MPRSEPISPKKSMSAARNQEPCEISGLAELEKGAVGRRFYKYGAPSGAFAAAGNREVFGSGQGCGCLAGWCP